MAYIDCDKCYHGRVCAHRHHYHDMIVECNHHIPTTDVVEVKHGEWVKRPCIKNFHDTNLPVVECSNCGISFCDIINNHEYMYRHCPHCGAKMDGRRDT